MCFSIVVCDIIAVSVRKASLDTDKTIRLNDANKEERSTLTVPYSVKLFPQD